MGNIYTAPADLLFAVEKYVPNWKLLTVDGWHGSGKTTLGRDISELASSWALGSGPINGIPLRFGV
jgi:ABC-type dipeptide/oligopeptide/nickel transport system ATPase subunit